MPTVLEELRAAITEHYESGIDLRSVAQTYVQTGQVSFREWNTLIAEVHGQLGNPAGNTLAPPRQRTPEPIGFGPGTELTKIFAAARVPSCQRCKDLAERMDRWAVAGCQEHKAEIVAELNERAKQFGWWTKTKAGAKLTAMGLVLNPLDPFPALVDVAIERAVKAAAQAPETALGIAPTGQADK